MEPSLAHARSSDGVSIAWSATGTGPAIVLMPGVPFSNFEAEWRIPVERRAVTAPAPRPRGVPYDGRGTGRPPRGGPGPSVGGKLAEGPAGPDAAGPRA